jgi:phosphoglycolate phosphatase
MEALLNKENAIRGIIFDMDNTLLQSHIDFPTMKQAIARFLIKEGVLSREFSIASHTTSTILAHIKAEGATDEVLAAALQIAEGYELTGMEGAGLEPGAQELLDKLRGIYTLALVTNNSYAAAIRALETTGIKDRFDLIVGRDQMEAMKPSPSGNLFVLKHFCEVEANKWISVGDSWIDGQAAREAKIPFISYGSGVPLMVEKGVKPVLHIDKLLSLLDYV